MPTWIDSHCHLDRYVKKNELREVLAGATHCGVEQLIAVGTSMEDWGLYQRLAKDHLGRIYFTVGLHPCYVEDDWEDQLQLIMPYFLDKPNPIALGEIGLDNFHLPKDPAQAKQVQERQLAAFRKQLSFAYQLDCPIIIHSRNAFSEVVQVIDESGIDWRKIVFHCFSEGPEEMEVLNKRGGRASFTGIITYKTAENVRQAMLKQGLDKLMIETDAPYLSPVPHRGKENFPAYVSLVGAFAAEEFGVSDVEGFSQQITENTQEFFNLYED